MSIMKTTWIEGYYTPLDKIVGVEKSDTYHKEKKDWVAILLVDRGVSEETSDVQRIKLREFCVGELTRYIMYLKSKAA
jgi:hypothetical protein